MACPSNRNFLLGGNHSRSDPSFPCSDFSSMHIKSLTCPFSHSLLGTPIGWCWWIQPLTTLHRDLETNTALKEFARTRGNGYIRMQYAATLHEIYGYIVGFIVFVGTLKFIKLLRFNKRMGESQELMAPQERSAGYFMLKIFSFLQIKHLAAFTQALCCQLSQRKGCIKASHCCSSHLEIDDLTGLIETGITRSREHYWDNFCDIYYFHFWLEMATRPAFWQFASSPLLAQW